MTLVAEAEPRREITPCPTGQAEPRAEGVIHLLRTSAAPEVIEFFDSPLAASLIGCGQLAPTEVMRYNEDGLHLYQPTAYFTSYPWEWPASLWMAAADLTLNVCSQMLNEDWALTDATPRNIVFDGPSPRLLGRFGVERLSSVRPAWLAYDQFVRTFLLPVLAHSQLGWPLQATQICPDGFEPEEVYTALSRLGRLKRPALSAVTWPVLLSRMMGSRLTSPHDPGHTAGRRTTDPQWVMRVVRKRLDDLRTAMQKAMPLRRSSLWLEWMETSSNDAQVEPACKQAFVAEALNQCVPKNVLDVGCGAGVYARMAAQGGADVVATDTNSRALDRLYAAVRYSEMKVLPLCVDLAYPTAAHGWENGETLSFLSRSEGRFDTVMVLSQMHRLLLRNPASMDRVAALFSHITTRNLIAEWVPPGDPQFAAAARGRESSDFTEERFRRSFGMFFDVVREMRLPNGRALFHMVKR